MRKLRLSWVIAGLVLFLCVGVGVALAAGPPDEVTIADCQSKQAPVKFPHKAHVAVTECGTCHHTQKDLKADSTVAVQKCGSCHVTPEKAETPKCAEMSMTKNPYHITCIGCHKQQATKDPATKAPTKCQNCHPKAAA